MIKSDCLAGQFHILVLQIGNTEVLMCEQHDTIPAALLNLTKWLTSEWPGEVD